MYEKNLQIGFLAIENNVKIKNITYISFCLLLIHLMRTSLYVREVHEFNRDSLALSMNTVLMIDIVAFEDI